MIASKAEIKSLAFGNNFDINGVKDNLIQVVEWEQVLTLLGTTLYDDVVTTPASYTTLLTYLKPFIAYQVKAYLSTSNHVKVGNKGSQVASGSNETADNPETSKREALSMAKHFEAQIVKWMKENGYEPKRKEADNVINKIIIL
jgi:hypothetical protein